MTDPSPDPLAQMDQWLASIGDLTNVIWTYYTHSLARGFNETQALILAGQYQQILLSNINT